MYGKIKVIVKFTANKNYKKETYDKNKIIIQTYIK